MYIQPFTTAVELTRNLMFMEVSTNMFYFVDTAFCLVGQLRSDTLTWTRIFL